MNALVLLGYSGLVLLASFVLLLMVRKERDWEVEAILIEEEAESNIWVLD